MGAGHRENMSRCKDNLMCSTAGNIQPQCICSISIVNVSSVSLQKKKRTIEIGKRRRRSCYRTCTCTSSSSSSKYRYQNHQLVTAMLFMSTISLFIDQSHGWLTTPPPRPLQKRGRIIPELLVQAPPPPSSYYCRSRYINRRISTEHTNFQMMDYYHDDEKSYRNNDESIASPMSSSSSSSSSKKNKKKKGQQQQQQPKKKKSKTSSKETMVQKPYPSTSTSTSSSRAGGPTKSTLDTALCIIPPDKAWDDIQRARHIVHDPSFYSWPPAIRLFHPFVPKNSIMDNALDVAKIIELYNIEPFNVTLDHLLVLPHLEMIEEMEENRKTLPNQIFDDDDDGDGDGGSSVGGGGSQGDNDKSMKKMSKEERAVHELIKSEERKGKKKLEKRLARERDKIRRKKEEHQELAKDAANPNANANVNADSNTDTNINTNTNDENISHSTATPTETARRMSQDQKSPRQLYAEQQKSKTQFNGPCILCLEPDEESQIHLQALREILRKKLFYDYDPFSSSSIFPRKGKTLDGVNQLPKSILEKHGLLSEVQGSNKYESRRKKKKQEGCTYRPLIVLGQFSTVAKAVENARRLQQLWDPLTFEVCDLQLLSMTGSDTTSVANAKANDNSNDYDPYRIKVDDQDRPILPENREYELRKRHGSLMSSSSSSSFANDKQDLSANGEYGCDAMVMLMGEEGQLLQPAPDDNDDDTVGYDIDNSAHEKEDNGYYLAKEDEDKILDLLMTKAATSGGAGGQKYARSHHIDDESEKIEQPDYDDDISDYVKDWLSEDDEYDEGATVVIGRTQFFMGETRQYTG